LSLLLAFEYARHSGKLISGGAEQGQPRHRAYPDPHLSRHPCLPHPLHRGSVPKDKRNAATSVPWSAQIRDTSDMEIPLSAPSTFTTSSTFRI